MEPRTTAGFSHSMSMDTSVASGWKDRGSLVAAAAGIAAIRTAAPPRAAGSARIVVVAKQDDQEHQQQDRHQDQDQAAAPQAGLARRRPGVATAEVAAAVLQLERRRDG